MGKGQCYYNEINLSFNETSEKCYGIVISKQKPREQCWNKDNHSQTDNNESRELITITVITMSGEGRSVPGEFPLSTSKFVCFFQLYYTFLRPSNQKFCVSLWMTN